MLADLHKGYIAALTDADLPAKGAALGIPIDPTDAAAIEAMVTSALEQAPERLPPCRPRWPRRRRLSP